MKRTLSVALLLLAALAPAQAQTLIIPPAATSFSVALTWTNSCNSALTCTFNVYRCTGAVTACPVNSQVWILLTSASIAPTSYNDGSVAQNTSYSYFVEAVATVSGVLETSGPSNEIAVAIPFAPVAPVLAQPATP